MRTVPRFTLATIGAGALLVSAIGTALPAQAAAPFTNPATLTTSTYQSVDGSYTWDEARADAEATGAPSGCTNHLAVITSQAEQDYVTGQLGGQPRMFIGAQRSAEDRTAFEWVTGEAFNYTNWADGEPNDTSPGEPYVQFANDTNAWNDIFSDATSGYILETECAATPPPAPTPQRAVVTSVSPSTGSSAGGTQVTITGQHFTGAKSVKFGPFKATTYTVDSDTQITATSPTAKLNAKGKPRKVDVRVQTVKSPSATSPADKFTYTAPPTDQ